MVLSLLALSSWTQAFQVSRYGMMHSQFTQREMSTQSFASSLEERPLSNFQKRLLQRMKKSNKKKSSKSKSSQSTDPTSSIQEVQTLQEFKRVVVDESNDQMVVVWFYAKWCRACKAVAKGVFALSRQYPDIKFVQVPVMLENTSLHQGLNVKSVPSVHLYHPTVGLVEERKLTRKYLPGFHKMLRDYQSGSCSLEQNREKTWSTTSPYEPVPKAIDPDNEGTLLTP